MPVGPEAISEPDPPLSAAFPDVVLESGVSEQRLLDSRQVGEGRGHQYREQERRIEVSILHPFAIERCAKLLGVVHVARHHRPDGYELLYRPPVRRLQRKRSQVEFPIADRERPARADIGPQRLVRIKCVEPSLYRLDNLAEAGHLGADPLELERHREALGAHLLDRIHDLGL